MTRRIAAAFAVALVLVACSLSTDRQPRDILDVERPTVVNTTVAPAPEPGIGSVVYFLLPAGESAQSPLLAVDRASQQDPTGLLTALLEGPTASEQASLGVRTAVPAGTALISTSSDNQGTLTVDLSAEFLGNAGDVLLDAVGQLVVTASRFPGVRRVRLLVEGEPQDWPTSSGTTTRDPLSLYDFIDRVMDTITTTTPTAPLTAAATRN